MAFKKGLKQFDSLLKYPRAAQNIEKFSELNPVPLKLTDYIYHGSYTNELARLKFLQYELLVRHANIIKEFYYVPEALTKHYEFQDTLECHANILDTLITSQDHLREKNDEQIVRNLSKSLNFVKTLHSETIPNTGEALRKCQSQTSLHHKSLENIQFFLQRLYMNKIATCNLIRHHQELIMAQQKSASFIGIVDLEHDIIHAVKEAHADSGEICVKKYNRCPRLVIRNQCISSTDGKTPIWPCIPQDVHYPLFEITKNSMRATCEEHLDKDELPPIKVTLRENKNGGLDIVVRDEGGGIPDKVKFNLFKFGVTTAQRPDLSEEEDLDRKNGNYTVNNSITMAGLGYGLGLSWLRSKYMNGQVKINTLRQAESGFTTSIIRIASLNSAQERIPVFNRKTEGFYLNPDVSLEYKLGQNYHDFTTEGQSLCEGGSRKNCSTD